MGFVYKNVPAFQLKSGDILAFDLGEVNDTNIQLRIDLARTTVNGGNIPKAFTTIVPNTQTPSHPRGDTIDGNYELQFKAAAPFSFSGGGLIIRLSHPSTSYLTDVDCDGVLTNAGAAADASGHFVERYFNDADGVPPYDDGDNGGDIAAFRLALADVPPPPSSNPGTNQPVTKKKCKKHKKHHAAAAKKKHCKKKK